MEDMESKLGAILGNPEMMAQIMNMAQKFGGTQAPPPPPEPIANGLDLGMITKFAAIAKGASIDENQQSLLEALQPYLTGQRIAKLGKAMRAAKLANLASGLLSSGILTGGG